MAYIIPYNPLLHKYLCRTRIKCKRDDIFCDFIVFFSYILVRGVRKSLL